jgi:hypothetical protein
MTDLANVWLKRDDDTGAVRADQVTGVVTVAVDDVEHFSVALPGGGSATLGTYKPEHLAKVIAGFLLAQAEAVDAQAQCHDRFAVDPPRRRPPPGPKPGPASTANSARHTRSDAVPAQCHQGGS